MHLPTPWNRLHRRGGASPVLLVLLPVLTLLIAIAVYACELLETRTSLQNTADAAALAAAGALVDDRGLLGNRDVALTLLDEARAEAIRYAAVNTVIGDPVTLHPQEDIRFGTLARPRGAEFEPIDLDDPESAPQRVNAVWVMAQMTGERGNPRQLHSGPLLSVVPTDARTVALAMLDRFVVGFRPLGPKHALPLAPIALLSDPTGRDRRTWEYQVERREGGDRWRCLPREDKKPDGPDRAPLGQGVKEPPDPKTVLEPEADGLTEMALVFGCGQSSKGKAEGSAQVNTCFLQLGAAGMEDVARQLTFGVSPTDLEPLGGQMVLGADNRLVVPGTPWAPGPGTIAFRRLQESLEGLRDRREARVWPLFQGFDPVTRMPVVTGFVAARVVQVDVSRDGELQVRVQPCMIAVAAAVTDSAPRDKDAPPVPVNAYVCKVRLVR